jgi:hypothetical protein
MQTRRSFLWSLATLGAGLGVLAKTGRSADAPVKLTETDPTAVALGYVQDSAKADAKKYPQHTNAQICSGCVLYQGKAGEESGPCGAFGGKLVSAKGWCMAYAKKP